MRQSLVFWGGLAWALLLCSGCGSGEGGGTVKAGGTLTVKGQPMADLTVTFTPFTGRPASCVTDASGHFVLSTFKSGDGAMPGPQKVSVHENYTEPPPMPGTPEYAAAGQKAPKFDPKYSDPDKSGLTAEVKAGDDNTKFTFDLK